MNSLYSFSVDARAGTAIAGGEREGEAESSISGVDRTGAGTLATSVALGITEWGAVVFGSERAKLLEREDLWEPTADLIGRDSTSFLATF